ncbi:response regulator [Paenibacillus hodogayensis]|uniref:Response regulator n=1 Tax=Paenibacillus hodogayensis TaxID=279208 RepID=A0ABV5W492_9BACL
MNQVNMLIVDDEPIICRGLRETVPWEEAGVAVVGEAYDGEEALKLIAELGVDLVLTDICMPVMDGLQLAEKVKESLPHVRLVILSGYGEFEYARQAVRLGIEDFLLKPAEIPEMLGMVSRIAGEIRSERLLELSRQRDKRLALLHELMRGGADGCKPHYAPDSGSMPSAPEGVYRFVASQAVRGAQWLERIEEPLSPGELEQWKSSVDSALTGVGAEPLSFYYHANVLLTFCIEREPLEEARLSAALANMTRLLDTGERLVFGLSETFRDWSEARRHGMSAIHYLHYAEVEPGRPVWYAPEVAAAEKSGHAELSPDAEKRMIQSFFQNDKEELARQVRSWIGELQAQAIPVKELFRLYEELRLLVLRRMRSNGADMPVVKTFDLHLYNTFETAGAIIVAELQAMLASLQPGAIGKNRWLVERAFGYIGEKAHYDLKASEVAAWLKITPSYFSVIFKQHAGCGFTEYINGLRIGRAKAYLSETHDRVFEIADKVGYKDYKYFVAVFKATTGVTPTEYRNMAGGKVG